MKDAYFAWVDLHKATGEPIFKKTEARYKKQLCRRTTPDGTKPGAKAAE
jgi:hypothetical protein